MPIAPIAGVLCVCGFVVPLSSVPASIPIHSVLSNAVVSWIWLVRGMDCMLVSPFLRLEFEKLRGLHEVG